eukprot:357580-Chlamydomonas_euryale.AAC.2
MQLSPWMHTAAPLTAGSIVLTHWGSVGETSYCGDARTRAMEREAGAAAASGEPAADRRSCVALVAAGRCPENNGAPKPSCAGLRRLREKGRRGLGVAASLETRLEAVLMLESEGGSACLRPCSCSNWRGAAPGAEPVRGLNLNGQRPLEEGTWRGGWTGLSLLAGRGTICAAGTDAVFVESGRVGGNNAVAGKGC